MELPSAEEFYGARQGPGLFQGDLFLCPASALAEVSRDGLQPQFLAAPPDEQKDLGRVSLSTAWSSPPGGTIVPNVGHLMRWGPVMVLSHECELEKDFNALVRSLVHAGVPERDAEERAGQRPDADRWVVVAPLLMDAEILEDWPPELRTDSRLADVRRGMRSGYMPTPAGAASVPPGAVALNRACVVSRGLLTEHRYLASLSATARGVLRYKLARTLAYRDLSVQAELERAIGQRIDAVVVRDLPRKKNEKRQIEMVLHLDSGDILQLQGAPLRPTIGDGPRRQRPRPTRLHSPPRPLAGPPATMITRGRSSAILTERQRRV